MKKLLLLPVLFIAFTSLAQTKLTIQSATSEKCVTVIASDVNHYRNLEFGDQGFDAGRGPFEGGFSVFRSFLQFDLSSIPTGSFVNWARLSLFGKSGQQGGLNSALLRRVTSPWNTATTTWDTQPATSKRGTIRLAISKNNSENYPNIIVTNLVQTMVDSPASSFGFALREDTDARGTVRRTMEFCSPGANEGPQTLPLLTIEYTAPSLLPAITSMSVDLSGASTEMTIYPNPCNKAFNCSIKSAQPENMTLAVIDMLGRTVYSWPVNPSGSQLTIKLSENTAGAYFVVLQNDKGETIVSQQLQVK